MIKRYDRPHTFFYIDPPYWGYENDYSKDIFGREDFIHLNELLKTIQGKFILSINDLPDTRKLFSNFKIETIETTYSLGKKKTKKASELLVMNY